MVFVQNLFLVLVRIFENSSFTASEGNSGSAYAKQSG